VRRRRPIWPPWTTAAAGGGGKGARGAWGSIPQLTSARGAAREQGDVNRRRRRCELRGEAVVAGEVWVRRSGAGGAFYSRCRSVWGGRGRWRVGGARRAARRALMALGRARASWSGARAARLCRDDGTCAAAVSTGRRCAGQRRAARGAARRARGLGGAHVAAARRVRPRPCAPCARARKRGEAQRGGAGGEAAVRGSGQPGSSGWRGGAPSTRSTRVDRLGGACRTSGGGGVRLGVSGAAWRAHRPARWSGRSARGGGPGTAALGA